MSVESSFKKVLDNAIIVLTGNMGANIFGLLSIAIFTHSLGAEIFGYYVLFLTYIGIIDRTFNFQTWQAFIKYATDFQIKNEEDNLMMLLKYSFLIDFFSLSIAFIVAFFSVGFFINFFNIPIEYTNLAVIMAISILFKVFEISTGIFRLFDEFKIQSKILIYVAVLKLMIFGVISLVQPTFSNFIYATVFVQFVALIMKLFYSKQILNQNGFKVKDIATEVVNYKLIKELKIFSFIVYNNFDVAVRMVSRQLDIVILGRLYGAEVVGVYRIAKEVANIIAKLTDPIYQAIYPEFAKLLSADKKLEAKQTAKKISLYAGVAGLGFYVLFILLGEFSIDLAFGDEFNGAYNIVLVYFVAIFVAIISLPLVPALHAKGLAKEAFWNQLFATFGYVIVLYPLTIYFSAVGTAVAYIVFYLIWLYLALKTIHNNKVFA